MYTAAANGEVSEELFLKSARWGDFEEVERLLAAGVDVDARERGGYHDGRTALMVTVGRLASYNGSRHLDVVALLVTKGADLEAKDNHGDTALLVAAGKIGYGDDTATVELLLEKGADVNAKNNRGDTALLVVMEEATRDGPMGFSHGLIDVVKLLLNKGADVNAQKRAGRTTPLLLALFAGYHKIAELLLEKGADVHAKNYMGQSALLVIVCSGTPDIYGPSFQGHLEVVELLLKKGVDINAQDDEGWTALMVAVEYRQKGLFELLLREGADVNVQDKEGCTALVFAVRLRILPAVELLVERGADVNAQDINGNTALHEAVSFSKNEEAHFLLEHGAVAVIDNDEHLTPLHLALKPDEGEPDVALICKMLLQSGALLNLVASGEFLNEAEVERIVLDLEQALQSPDFLLEYGEAAFHLAAAMGGRNVVKLLVEQGVNVNAKNVDGWTPLYTAVFFHQYEVAHFLLEHGAVAVIANNNRHTPLGRALRPWGSEPDVELISKMLLPSGALVDLATDVVDAHEKRLKRIVKGLKRAAEGPGFLEDLADTMAGIDATGCVRDTGKMLWALLRQLDAFAKADDDGADEPEEPERAPKRRRLGGAYLDRRGRHGLALAAAVRKADFLSNLAEGLADVNLFASDPGAPKQLVASAVALDALAEGGAQQQQGEAAGAPRRGRRGAA